MNSGWTAVLVAVVLWGAPFMEAAPAVAPPQPATNLLAKALAGPLREVEEIIYVTRARYDDSHWYANIGYYCDDENKKAYAGNGAPDVGKLCKWNLRTGRMTVLLDAKGGSVRDPQVHYDGKKILFSYRPSGTDHYHLYEINTDGTGLRQITSGPYDDYEPTYLPDGDILFVSTRAKRWVNCWMTQVGIMFRGDANGQHITQVSANTEHDNTPWVMPDGRILYTRWEYVDRSQVEYHHLWVMNPDGTGAMVYYGNMHSWTVMIDAKPVPNSDKVVACFSPGHGVNEHAGIATLVSPQSGPDNKGAAVPLHKGKHVRDPYPLAENCVIAAQDNKIVLLDGSGAVETVFTHPANEALHEPRPVLSRPREPVIPHRVQPAATTGRMILADVYQSRNLPGVKRGEIKKLLLLESLPKPVNFSGGPDLTSFLGTFTLERVLGTVPVEPDGSAYFEMPANRQIFFVALDEKDLSVKRMQSFTSVMPGETMSCAGCHEPRAQTPRESRPGPALQALRRPPSHIQPFEGFPDVIDLHRDVQPVLDRACVPCHNPQKAEGRIILTGDLGPHFSHSYFTIIMNQLVADGRNGLGNQPPRSLGSSASRLLKLGDGSHYGARYTEREWRMLWLWIESAAPYAGSYAALRNEETQRLAGQAAGIAAGALAPIQHNRCGTCHNGQPDGLPINPTHYNLDKRRAQAGRPTAQYERLLTARDPYARYGPDILFNFSRPEFSKVLLAPLSKSAGGYGWCGEIFKNTEDPDYRKLLAAIREAKALIEKTPRYGMPSFVPNRQYLREMKRFGLLPPHHDAAQAVDFFALDQQYWRSLWRYSSLP